MCKYVVAQAAIAVVGLGRSGPAQNVGQHVRRCNVRFLQKHIYIACRRHCGPDCTTRMVFRPSKGGIFTVARAFVAEQPASICMNYATHVLTATRIVCVDRLFHTGVQQRHALAKRPFGNPLNLELMQQRSRRSTRRLCRLPL